MTRLHRGDRGSAVIEWPLTIALLLLPVGLMVLTFPTWTERQTVARSAAQESARIVVLADSFEEGVADAREAVTQTAINFGVDPSTVHVTFAGDWGRGGSITATVTVTMPAVQLPGLGNVGSWTWSASHTERVDDYRSLS